jgi:hypothetical protein
MTYFKRPRVEAEGRGRGLVLVTKMNKLLGLVLVA